MLKGLLMRRQSSQVSADAETSSPEITPSSVISPGGVVQSPGGGGAVLSPGELAREPVYGDPTQDQGDEVRFYVELTKLDGLKDTYSIDIRRLKGNLRSYKFLYDCITECVYNPSSLLSLFSLSSITPLTETFLVFFCICFSQPPCPSTLKETGLSWSVIVRRGVVCLCVSRRDVVFFFPFTMYPILLLCVLCVATSPFLLHAWVPTFPS